MQSLKNLIIKAIICFILFAGIAVINAQSCATWGSGEDSIKALQEYSLYREYYKAQKTQKEKDYSEVIEHWRYVYNNAPGARLSPFVDGIKIIEDRIKANKENREVKSAYIDTLLGIYDKRIECHGNEGKVLGMKAGKVLKYRSKTHLRVILEDYNKSIDMEGVKSNPQVLSNYFKAAIIAVRKDTIAKEEAFSIYLKIIPIIEQNIKQREAAVKPKEVKERESFIKTRKKIEEGLKKIIKDCSEAKVAFEESYKKRPDDPQLWTAIFSIYRNLGEECTKDPVFNEVALKLFEKDSSAIYAIVVALNTSDATIAKKFFDLAILKETNNNKKANYAMKYAKYAKDRLGSMSAARTYALKASGFKPDWGEPYLFIGNLYAASGKACGLGTGFKSQSVVWPAMDMWEKARNDPKSAPKAQKQINKYKEYLPSKQDCFMSGITEEGQNYNVACWINVSTRVRFKR
ncbi:MAG TPA: hypothetical protein EYQ86_00290 [Bacteroidetes bacterium]|nr:hypothetical protein [Bacteroidota bacterium]